MSVSCSFSRVKSQGLQILGGSVVVISWVIGPLIWVISIVTLFIVLLRTTHEPPSTVYVSGRVRDWF